MSYELKTATGVTKKVSKLYQKTAANTIKEVKQLYIKDAVNSIKSVFSGEEYFYNNGEVAGWSWRTVALPGTTTYSKTSALYMKKNDISTLSIAGWGLDIDVTNLKSLIFYLDNVIKGSTSYFKVGIDSDIHYSAEKPIDKGVEVSASNTPQKIEVDVSDMTGNTIIQITGYSRPGHDYEFTCSKVAYALL